MNVMKDELSLDRVQSIHASDEGREGGQHTENLNEFLCIQTVFPTFL